MIKFKSPSNIPKDFTGICKILFDLSINYFEKGNLHREDGPALEYADGFINWFYKGELYGYNNDFTIESWKEKVKELKRAEELKIFI